MSEEELNKLLDSSEETNTDNIDIYSDIYINSFKSIIFTDGSCIGKRTGTKFGGSGVYIHSSHIEQKYNKWNSYKIFEKPPQEEVLIKDYVSKKIIFLGDRQSEECYKYICFIDDCNSIGYALEDDKLMCSRHKTESSIIKFNYEQFQPTNIRSEGNAILLALKTILYIDNVENEISSKKLKKHLTYSSTKKLYNISTLDLTEIKFEDVISGDSNEHLIVSDSKFWIELITKWMSGWVSKRVIMEKKNIDIILKILITLNEMMEKGHRVKFQHINGHQDKKQNADINFYHKGNILADKLATHASKSKDNKLSVIA